MNEPARIQNDKEEAFQFGKADRKAGRPCRFANGAYLDGWYSTEDQTHYCMNENRDNEN